MPRNRGTKTVIIKDERGGRGKSVQVKRERSGSGSGKSKSRSRSRSRGGSAPPAPQTMRDDSIDPAWRPGEGKKLKVAGKPFADHKKPAPPGRRRETPSAAQRKGPKAAAEKARRSQSRARAAQSRERIVNTKRVTRPGLGGLLPQELQGIPSAEELMAQSQLAHQQLQQEQQNQLAANAQEQEALQEEEVAEEEMAAQPTMTMPLPPRYTVNSTDLGEAKDKGGQSHLSGAVIGSIQDLDLRKLLGLPPEKYPTGPLQDMQKFAQFRPTPRQFIKRPARGGARRAPFDSWAIDPVTGRPYRASGKPLQRRRLR